MSTRRRTRETEEVSCPCGATNDRRLGEFIYWERLGYVRCDGCGLVRVSPRLTPAEVADTFDSDYFDHANLEYWGERRRPVFREVVSLVNKFGKGPVLDVGAGYGHFVQYLDESGYEAEGIEIAEETARIGQERLGVRVERGTVQELRRQSYYGTVCSLDTLYYASDPVGDLDAMRRLLQPDGVIVLRLRRNWLLGLRLALRRDPRSRRPFPAEHLWGFTPRTITGLLRREHWRILHVGRAVPSQGGGVLARLNSFNVVAQRPPSGGE